MTKSTEINWLSQPAAKDYPAAENYLQLVFKKKRAVKLANKLRRARVTKFAAKDILRASGLPLAGMRAFDWKIQRNEVKNHTPLSPILLVRRGGGKPLVVADGFHRLCAVFAFDQQADVLCKIV